MDLRDVLHLSLGSVIVKRKMKISQVEQYIGHAPGAIPEGSVGFITSFQAQLETLT